LLVLTKTEYLHTLEGWNIITYENFITKLSNIKGLEKYHKYLVNDYCRMVNMLIQVVKQYCIDNKYDFIGQNKEVISKFKQARLLDMYLKYNASRLMAYIKYHIDQNKKLISDINNNKVKLNYSFGLNHSHSTVDIVLEVNEIFYIGIQIEDDQYRRTFEYKNVNKSELVYEQLVKKNIWFNSDWRLNQNTDDDWKKIKPRGDYCTYNANKDSPTFIYQYKKMRRSFTFEELSNYTCNEITYIISNIKEIKKIATNCQKS
jgi:hypothetical protein